MKKKKKKINCNFKCDRNEAIEVWTSYFSLSAQDETKFIFFDHIVIICNCDKMKQNYSRVIVIWRQWRPLSMCRDSCKNSGYEKEEPNKKRKAKMLFFVYSHGHVSSVFNLSDDFRTATIALKWAHTSNQSISKLKVKVSRHLIPSPSFSLMPLFDHRNFNIWQNSIVFFPVFYFTFFD